MRKVVLQLAISLDGYIEGPNGEYDWCFTDEDYGMTEFLERVDSMFIGRKSYELTQTMHESEMAPFAHLTTYIFSNTLLQVKPGAILIKEDIEAQVRRILNEPGKDIWLFGGADLSGSLLKAGLIDEVRLAVHPIILGSGKVLFNNIAHRVPLELIETKVYSSGLVALSYLLHK